VLGRPDFVLVGTGIAPLLAAAQLMHEGRSVLVLNPDTGFFKERSELPLDILFFENANSDLGIRFHNNTPEQVYRNLSPDFPGALEMWKPDSHRARDKDFVDDRAPWVRARNRLWVARRGTDAMDRFENLYLRALDAGLRPKWLEGLSLAKHFPGFSAKDAQDWVGFLGPALGDVDVERYQAALLGYLYERIGESSIRTSVILHDIGSKGLSVQSPGTSPQWLLPTSSVLFFWTPKLMRFLTQKLAQFVPEGEQRFKKAVKLQTWEEWELLSRRPVSFDVVAQWDRIRVWAQGSGAPSPMGSNRMNVLVRSGPDGVCSSQSLKELEALLFQFLGWDRFSVRSMVSRDFYRWNSLDSIEFESGPLRVQVLAGCDGPLHWIAQQVRNALVRKT
jgi:hypothetical protein